MSTFLNGFEGLWRRPVKDYKKAVREYLIAIDTNVLLELYRFTPQAREELLDVLNQLGHRLYVPHQVVTEYYSKRVTAVKEHLALYDSVPNTLAEYKAKALQELNTFAKRCSMSDGDRKRLIEPIENSFDKVSSEISRHQKSFDLSLEKVVSDDPVLATLAKILNNKTGGPFTEEDSAQLIIEFERRVKEKIPPGYKDAGKSENAHGDFFVWEQLLRRAQETSMPLLFVTNDAKEDWIRKEAGLIVGARPELLAEFTDRCGGDFLITQLLRFLQIAKEELGASVSASTMAQAKNLRDSSSDERIQVTLPTGTFYAALEILNQELQQFASGDQIIGAENRKLGRAQHRQSRRIFQAMLESMQPTANGDVVCKLDASDISHLHQVLNQDVEEEASLPKQATSADNRFSEHWYNLARLEKTLKQAHAGYEVASFEYSTAKDSILALPSTGNPDTQKIQENVAVVALRKKERMEQMITETQNEISRLMAEMNGEKENN